MFMASLPGLRGADETGPAGGSTRDDGVGVEVLQGCGPELQGDGGRGRGVDGGQHLDQVAAPERPACPSLVSA